MLRVGIDIGGTFTDFVLYDPQSGDIRVHKRLTSYPDPSASALAGLEELLGRERLALGGVELLIHATTLVTNALIERRGARVGLLTTRGFRDVLELGREQRYDIYDLFLRFPEPLVPRRLRREVAERLDAEGRVLQPLDLAQARAELQALVAEGIEALAVVFLHAYRNPLHERQVQELVQAEFPGLYVSLSSEVAPEIREYERTSTTVANAYVQPVVDRYLAALERELLARGFRGRFALMHSAGGLMAPATARALPVRLLESGPAAGALAAALLGAAMGRSDLLAFDMGGTTAKAALIRGGRPDVTPVFEVARVHRFKRGSGLPVRVAAVDLIEIGAGGGSIARAGRLGTLQVGPESAASDPGPACYGRGGTLPTVTDADLVLGYLSPDAFLGGRLRLDVAAAREAIRRHVAEPLGLGLVEAAWGIHRVVNENMANALRVHAMEKGEDPRRFALFAFGGAGPVHALRVARLLGIREVIVPPAAGVASALGLVAAPASFEVARSVPAALDALDGADLERIFAALEQEARERLAALGVAAEAVERSFDARFLGQVHELTVDLPAGAADPRRLAEAFVAAYAQLFGHVVPDGRIQLLACRVRARGSQSPLRLRPAAGTPGRARKGSRPAYVPEAGGFVEVPVFDRYGLAAGEEVVGPAVVEEAESTTVLGPGDRLRVDPWGNLVVAVAEREVG